MGNYTVEIYFNDPDSCSSLDIEMNLEPPNFADSNLPKILKLVDEDGDIHYIQPAKIFYVQVRTPIVEDDDEGEDSETKEENRNPEDEEDSVVEHASKKEEKKGFFSKLFG